MTLSLNNDIVHQGLNPNYQAVEPVTSARVCGEDISKAMYLGTFQCISEALRLHRPYQLKQE